MGHNQKLGEMHFYLSQQGLAQGCNQFGPASLLPSQCRDLGRGQGSRREWMNACRQWYDGAIFPERGL
jgi:hypothetical protein